MWMHPVSIWTTWFTQQKQWGLYQNKVTSSLAAIQRPGHWADNCNMVLGLILSKIQLYLSNNFQGLCLLSFGLIIQRSWKSKPVLRDSLYKSSLTELKSDKNTTTNRVGNPKQVLVPKTLKATIVLRLTEIDQVIIRGIQESSLLEKEVRNLRVSLKFYTQRSKSDFLKVTSFDFPSLI